MEFSDDFFKLSGKNNMFLTPILERKESNCDQYGRPRIDSSYVNYKTIQENDESSLFDRLCLSPESNENSVEIINKEV